MCYKLECCSWDITDKCNLNCYHCGSKSEKVYEDMSTEEALDLAIQLGEMKLEKVVFTGGEPLLRDDWDVIAKKLWEYGVEVHIITNGTLIDEQVIKRMLDCHIANVGISIDGTEQIHNQIRALGVYEKCVSAFSLLQEADIPVGAITTIMKENLDILEDIHNELVKMGVISWQLQIGVPYGNMKENKGSLIEPSDMDKIIDFCYEAAKRNDMLIYPADCIGYYTKKERAVRERFFLEGSIPQWKGCRAGISSCTIRNNGSIVGVSMSMEEDSQGNVKERPLKDIWEDKKSFSQMRYFDCDRINGFCKECAYLHICKGGCFIMRIAFGGGIYAENEFCAYRNSCLNGIEKA